MKNKKTKTLAHELFINGFNAGKVIERERSEERYYRSFEHDESDFPDPIDALYDLGFPEADPRTCVNNKRY